MIALTGNAVVTIDLDDSGYLVDFDSGRIIPTEGVADWLDRTIALTPEVTDIFVFVHGWRNSTERASQSISKLVRLLQAQLAAQEAMYRELTGFFAFFVLIRWPSMSNPFPEGYRRIRDRAHAMTTQGHAEFVIAHILGYLNSIRELPSAEPPTLRTNRGQYLHCIGHSFGGRFLCEAIMAANEPTAPTLAWPWARNEYPYTVDTLLVFQMATRPDDFADRYSPLLTAAPISGPVVLTFSHADRALRLWHRFAEGTPGLGAYGATAPRDTIQVVRMPRMDEYMTIRPENGRIVSVDSTWRFKRGRISRPEGAHSDIWYPESANLVLSLADAARP
jgi:esterase/lipase superfamily enzyme